MYRMQIISKNSQTVFNPVLNENIKIITGKRYKVTVAHPTTKKARANNGRQVELLGFSDDFMPDAIVRYEDNGRRGRVNPTWLVPIN